MPRLLNDLTGKIFGDLEVIKLDHVHPRNGAFFLCKCDCGKEVVVSANNLKSGGTKIECGCYRAAAYKVKVRQWEARQ